MAEAVAKNEQVIVGVDFGGTKILSGVFTNSLECLGVVKTSTKSSRGTKVVIDRIARCIRDAVDEADLSFKQVRGVGIGAPGAVDGEEGNVIFAPNLQWRDVPLKSELEHELQVPVFVENDCNIASLGVYYCELESKPKNMLGIFIGTGIGAGLIVNGSLYSGFGHTAGEVGHMVLDVNGPKCGCGNKGCLEALASRTAIFNRIKEAVKDGQKTILTDMLGDGLEDMRSGDLRKAVRRGDKFVSKIVDDAAEYIGIAVSNLANVLNPEVIVLGGGVMEALGDEMLETIRKVAKEHAMPGAMKGVSIIDSHLGDNAGITGGAVLAKKMSK